MTSKEDHVTHLSTLCEGHSLSAYTVEALDRLPIEAVTACRKNASMAQKSSLVCHPRAGEFINCVTCATILTEAITASFQPRIS